MKGNRIKLEKLGQIIFENTGKNKELRRWTYYNRKLENMSYSELTDEYYSIKVNYITWKLYSLIPIALGASTWLFLVKYMMANVSPHEIQYSNVKKIVVQQVQQICNMYGYLVLIFFALTWIVAVMISNKCAILKVSLILINKFEKFEKKQVSYE